MNAELEKANEWTDKALDNLVRVARNLGLHVAAQTVRELSDLTERDKIIAAIMAEVEE